MLIGIALHLKSMLVCGVMRLFFATSSAVTLLGAQGRLLTKHSASPTTSGVSAAQQPTDGPNGKANDPGTSWQHDAFRRLDDFGREVSQLGHHGHGARIAIAALEGASSDWFFPIQLMEDVTKVIAAQPQGEPAKGSHVFLMNLTPREARELGMFDDFEYAQGESRIAKVEGIVKRSPDIAHWDYREGLVKLHQQTEKKFVTFRNSSTSDPEYNQYLQAMYIDSKIYPTSLVFSQQLIQEHSGLDGAPARNGPLEVDARYLAAYYTARENNLSETDDPGLKQAIQQFQAQGSVIRKTVLGVNVMSLPCVPCLHRAGITTLFEHLPYFPSPQAFGVAFPKGEGVPRAKFSAFQREYDCVGPSPPLSPSFCLFTGDAAEMKVSTSHSEKSVLYVAFGGELFGQNQEQVPLDIFTKLLQLPELAKDMTSDKIFSEVWISLLQKDEDPESKPFRHVDALEAWLTRNVEEGRLEEIRKAEHPDVCRYTNMHAPIYSARTSNQNMKVYLSYNWQQTQILKEKAGLFFSHGGAGSGLRASLFSAVPQVAMPSRTGFDQPYIARLIQGMGFGEDLDAFFNLPTRSYEPQGHCHARFGLPGPHIEFAAPLPRIWPAIPTAQEIFRKLNDSWQKRIEWSDSMRQGHEKFGPGGSFGPAQSLYVGQKELKKVLLEPLNPNAVREFIDMGTRMAGEMARQAQELFDEKAKDISEEAITNQVDNAFKVERDALEVTRLGCA